jgi:hypothetical protein
MKLSKSKSVTRMVMDLRDHVVNMIEDAQKADRGNATAGRRVRKGLNEIKKQMTGAKRRIMELED